MDRAGKRRPRLRWRRLWLLAPAALAGWLIWFHALLFWERLADLSLFHPAVGLKWLAGLAALAAWARLRRQQASPLGGRRALALALLLILVHLQAPVAAGDSTTGEHTAQLLLALPVSLSLVTVWWQGRRLAGPSVARTRPRPPRLFAATGPPPRSALLSGHLPSLSSRPPPL